MIGIKGIKMPECCRWCPCHSETDDMDYCNATKYPVKTIYGTIVFYKREIPWKEVGTIRQPWCPMVEIEEGSEDRGPVED